MLRSIMHACRVAAAAMAVAALAALVPLEAAFAQVASKGGGDSDVVLLSVAELILGALGTVALPTILAIWSLIKARAAESEATWDDWVVARVEKVAREVMSQAAAQGSAGASAAPLDLTGKIGKGGQS